MFVQDIEMNPSKTWSKI